MSLDLYAKIEPYIGFYDEYERLYEIYIEILKDYSPRTILDIGCGNGRMLELLKESGFDAKGIDISKKMVQIAKQRGVDAECKKIEDVKESFDAIVAVADVLNYMDKNSLKDFFKQIQRCLKDNGVFICDINTLHGFSDVADGAMVKESENGFLSVDAVFDGEVLETSIIFFEKFKDDFYKKFSGIIKQYYHKESELLKSTSLKCIEKMDAYIFSDESDKRIYLFKNSI